MADQVAGPDRRAADHPAWPSTLDSVVVHSAGAVCRRLARGTLPEAPGGGPVRLLLTGLPRSLRPDSLRAAVVGGSSGLRVTEVRLAATAEPRETADLPELRRLLAGAEQRCRALKHRQELLESRITETAALRVVTPAKRREDPHRRAPADAVLALADFVDERLAGLQDRAEEVRERLRTAEHERELLHDRVYRGSDAEPGTPVETSAIALLTLTPTEPAEAATEADEPAEPEAGGPPDTAERTAEAATSGPPDTAGLAPDLTIELEYRVPGALWVPAYQLSHHRDEARGTLTLRASVAQRTGEDWTGVRLGLSTADLERRSDLPRLRSIRIGRRQPPPPPSGWREPPPGLTGLFGDYDGAEPPPWHARPAVAEGGRPLLLAGAASLPEEEESARLGPQPVGYGAPTPQADTLARRSGFGGAPRAMHKMAGPAGPPAFAGAPAPAAPAAPPAPGAPAPSGAPSASYGASFAAPAPPPPPPAPLAPGAELLDYAALTLAGPAEPAARRGRLHPAEQGPDGLRGAEARRRAEGLAGALALPAHAVRPRLSAGSFDQRHDAEARADIPSDGGWHTVTIGEIPVSPRTEYVCVPSVDPAVYATLLLANESAQALLAGPLEVTVDGEFLLGTALPTLAPGATRRVGLGVAESVRATRRTEVRESTAGLRGTTTVIEQRVHVELANRLGHPVTVEVRERIPVVGDKDIRLEERPSSPPWSAPATASEAYPAGTRLWRVELPPGGRVELDGGYETRIPAGKALADGNRRS